MTKFSLIIYAQNSNSGLKKTLNSILRQDFDSYEVVAIIGAGDKKTKSIIKKYTEIFKDKLRFIICDNGVGFYGAINNGVRVAKGKYLSIIEAGNILEKNSLTQALKSAEKYPEADVTYGVWGPWEKRHGLGGLVDVMAQSLPIKNTTHKDLYYKKELHHKFGFYNAKENIVVDYAFCLKAFYLGEAIVRPFDIISNKSKDELILQNLS